MLYRRACSSSICWSTPRCAAVPHSAQQQYLLVTTTPQKNSMSLLLPPAVGLPMCQYDI
jgi:hypothetical protein